MESRRVCLPERFNLVLQRVIATTGANYISLRRWQPYGNRFGKPEEVARMVAEELASMIDEDELARIEGMRSPIAGGWASSIPPKRSC